ncbi:hypothetical protein CWR48_01060 [Oceanobacillus arenosus]|uniref:DUF4003 domain-containing protein n=1 Tax=Oceanobacillus arenosus TaxID=1229153 RepID=A0A3D8Q1L5_9BACI|nr:DUF4003 family protein [Oceanobacillus arenosus]RDW22326.1 hypothetical protein CWR48_01060 [Oceanobacillus arenosus]
MQQSIISNYTQLYEELKSRLKWKVSDNQILMCIASLYVIGNKNLNMERLLQIADTIKRNAGFFSSMQSYSRFTTAAMLDVNFEDPEAQVPMLFDLYERCKAAKFPSGTYTYIAASIILKNQEKQGNPDSIIMKAKEIYDGMKKEHLFLTDASDYPLATLLAYENRDDIIQQIENYYEKLNNQGFRKGNDLQFMSHILSLDNHTNDQGLVTRSTYVADEFQRIGIKRKPGYYPVIAMLALLPQEEFDMDAIFTMYEALNQEKYFRWQKDMNLIMAVSFFVSKKLGHDELAETRIITTLETIIQAQQAVMISTITASTIAASSNNNTN